jgi:hypothetical protein
MNCFIVLLPEDVHYLVASYLLPDRERNKTVFKFSEDWRNFMNTNNEYYGEMKRRTRFISLTRSASSNFKAEKKFRKRVFRLTDNSLNQLEIHFKPDCRRERISLRSFLILPLSLRLVRYVVNLRGSPPLLKFSCHDCSIATGGNWIDIDILVILEEASFVNMNLRNYHKLSHLKSLSISNTDSITDVSCFGNIPVLKLHDCNAITDVSCLANVPELELSYCDGIINVSALGRVNNLNLQGCKHISDISALGNVHILNLEECQRVASFFALTNVYELHLSGKRCVNLSGLENIKILFLKESWETTNISRLTKMKALHLDQCPDINDFRGLVNLRELFIRGDGVDPYAYPLISWCDSELYSMTSQPGDFELVTRMNLARVRVTGDNFDEFVDDDSDDPEDFLSWKYFKNTRYLSCKNCYLSDYSGSLHCLYSLTLYRCLGLERIPEIPFVAYLSIKECLNLTKIHLSESQVNYPIYAVEIKSCYDLTEVRVSRKTAHLKVESCKIFSELIVKRRIDYLKTKECPKLKVRQFARIVVHENSA